MLTALEDLSGYDNEQLLAHVRSEYDAPIQDTEGVKFRIAYESTGSWGCDSSSFFVFEKDGQLFENNASHCSCYGFENQWEPEPTTQEALLRRGYFSLGGYDNSPEENKAAIKKAIAEL